MTDQAPAAPRCAALVGPYLSGKTTLLESILHTAGVVNRRGSVKEGNTVGDSSAEARARNMSTEVSLAHFDYLGDPWAIIDCPGSIELVQEAYNALMVADVAVVVTESGTDKVLTVSPLMKFLGDREIPHAVFINKMDTQATDIRETIEGLQNVASKPLVLREIPIMDGETIVGMVDVVSQRAYKWTEGEGPSEEIPVPDSLTDWIEEARTQLLESLADFDDTLLERLLEDDVPPVGEVFKHMTTAISHGLIVPVLFGAAEHVHGITRLLKLLRHDIPGPERVAARLGIEGDGEAVAQVFKTLNASHTGKLSISRVLRGEIAEGSTLNGVRPSGMFSIMGGKQEKKAKAVAGDVVAFARMDEVDTGDVLSPSGDAVSVGWPEPLKPLYSVAIKAEQRADEVKLSGALARVTEEDPSITYGHNSDTGELVMHGQGDMHLQVIADRLKNRFGVSAVNRRPLTPYKETIRKPVSQHARHKKQSGGHGQFGDVHLDIKPLPRGGGFEFSESISGGVVPRQYFPAVEAGVREFLVRGPLGFPVVDVAVTLTDGQYHTVDSSEMAFKTAAAMGMREGMPKCDPVLLEPIQKVNIAVPTEFTSKVQRLVTGRRGQLLGFDAKPDWSGWDEVQALIPASETTDMINELRSLTLGIGTFTSVFDHLQELSGKPADDVVAARKAELEAD